MNIFLMKHALWVALVLFFSALYAAPLYAEEEKPTVDATAAVLSKYVWRGYELSRNSAVVQPSLAIGYKGFSASIWGNLDTHPYFSGTDPNKSYSSTWNETDLTLSYSKTLGLFNLGAGYIYYALGPANPDAAKPLDAQEVFASMGLNTMLSPVLAVYKEIDHYNSWYFQLGLSHVFELNKTVSLKLAASAAYLLSENAGTYPKYGDSGLASGDKFNNLHDGSFTVSLPVRATTHLTLTPVLSYVFPLSGDARNEVKGKGLSGTSPANRDSSYFYGGVMAGFSF